MTVKQIYTAVAFIVAIPGLVLVANMVCYAFIGAGFLPALIPGGDMAVARAGTFALSFLGASLVMVSGSDK
jgi:hypothetical protein